MLVGSGAANSNVFAQGSIPVLRGVYQGSSFAMNCVAAGSAQVTVTITSQANDRFSGQGARTDGAGGATVFFSGTVDSSGNLQGTYDYSTGGTSGQGTFTGTFDGTAVPKTLHLDFTGTITAPPISCRETITFDGTLLTAGGASADLSITGSAFPSPVATGNSVTYNLTVANAGPSDATATFAVDPAPIGISIVNATSSQGICSAAPGGASCSLGTVLSGGTATIIITAIVFAPPGSTLVGSPSVSSNVFDPNLSNNSTNISTPVVGGALAKLKWSQQQSTQGSSTPAPTGLQVQPGPSPPSEPAPSSASALEARASDDSIDSSASVTAAIPMDSCSLINVNVYRSDHPNVQPIQANLFSRLTADALEGIVPVAPVGSSYAVTNFCNAGLLQSRAPSRTRSTYPQALPSQVSRFTGKLKILGSGFSGQVQVFVDGVEFVKAAVLADSTLLVQKGPLTDGTAISDIGASKSVLVTVKNGDGGFASFIFKRP